MDTLFWDFTERKKPKGSFSPGGALANSNEPDGRNLLDSAADNSPLQRALQLVSCSTSAQKAFVMQQHEAREQNSNVISCSISYYRWVRHLAESVRWREDGKHDKLLQSRRAGVKVQFGDLVKWNISVSQSCVVSTFNSSYFLWFNRIGGLLCP